MIKLKNLQRRMRVFNLEHPTFLNAPGEHPAGHPETLTLLPLEVREVHEDVLLCAEVKAALTDHEIRRPTLRVIGN